MFNKANVEGGALIGSAGAMTWIQHITNYGNMLVMLLNLFIAVVGVYILIKYRMRNEKKKYDRNNRN